MNNLRNISDKEGVRAMHIVSWSGGKDSTATIILAHEHNIPIDLIIMSIVWFDKKRIIYGENPEHIEWVLNYAIPLFKSWGYKVELVSSDRDYLYWFHKVRTGKCRNAQYIGKKYGWLIGGLCKMNPEKTQPIHKYLKAIQEPYTLYEGIAIDEPERLKKMNKRGHISLLERFNICENDTYPMCENYGLLSPVYKKRNRQGCWFCPNQSIKELADTKQHHPELWRELQILSVEQNTVTRGFKYGKTFAEIEVEVDKEIERQQWEARQMRWF